MAQDSRVGSCDTVIIGNGPSALILSYILHGNIPYYVGKHGDSIIDQKLRASPNLLKATPDIYAHFRSSLKYSTQALPINTLLDTLLRPGGDTNPNAKSCIEWRHEPEKAISHIVLGDAPNAGGQWANNPVPTSPDIGSLSYGEQLSLPGYTLTDHWMATKGKALPELIRPTRRDIAEYLAAYPKGAGIADAVRTSTRALHVVRTQSDFIIGTPNIHCKHLVLASGTFTINLPPPHFLHPMIPLDADSGNVLVIGSGFTAADIISSTPPDRKIIHIFNWEPEHRPSPLAACNKQAYPEYWWIFQQMRLAATRYEGRFMRIPSKPKEKHVLASFAQRDWIKGYEGFPNSRIMSVTTPDAIGEDPMVSSVPTPHAHSPPATDSQHGSHNLLSFLSRRRTKGKPAASSASSTDTVEPTTIFIGRSAIGDRVTRHITSFHYAAGRRGSLSYLSPGLLQEVLSPADAEAPANAAHPQHLPLRGRISVDFSSGGPTRRGSSVPSSAGAMEEALAAAVQRRGSEEHDFAQELLISHAGGMVSGHTLRGRIEDSAADIEDSLHAGAASAADSKLVDPFAKPAAAAAGDGGAVAAPTHAHHPVKATRKGVAGLEVAPNVFVIGSLTGDSLIRFAYGGCVVVAGAIMADRDAVAAAT